MEEDESHLPNGPTVYKGFADPSIPCNYNRAKALADGREKKVSVAYIKQLKDDWDMLLTDHIYLTKQVVETCRIPDLREPDEGRGRLWDILNVLEVAIGNSWWNPIDFEVSFGGLNARPKVTLRAVWTTVDIDDPTTAITVKLADEP